MNEVLAKTALIQWLRKRSKIYSGKIEELDEQVQKWLEYVPEAFPHYPSHTIRHSAQIISQLSHLLFHDGNPTRPSLRLTHIEAYVLIAAAYLHDSGMVVGNSEKIEILSEPGWREFLQGDAAARWKQIEEFRNGKTPADESVRNFIADLRTRYLIAEYVRRIHHERAGDIIAMHEIPLGGFSMGDDSLRQTISDVCVAHGFDRKRLDDRNRFPIARQIRGENANVRLLAILLRVGDLLDLESSRACPILLNVANPLPAESKAHWSQYKRITQRYVSPEKIEIRALCQTAEEHRVLRDWCQWIVDEVRAAPHLLAQSDKAKVWRPPLASMDAEPTIERAPGATYLVRDWRFTFDEASVFKRLISDVYGHRERFVIELIQNSLDAMRCQMYDDYKAGKLPSTPSAAPEDIRNNYPLKVSLTTALSENPFTGEKETRQAVVVEDCGIGMDEPVIREHLLQVGRSFYTTEEFRSRYSFVPTSRFGIGFLSVFALSDDVVVESRTESGRALRLQLRGPRNYIIVEEGSRTQRGTRVEVRLNPDVQIPAGRLTAIVQSKCKMVEFPITVIDSGKSTVVRAERPGDFDFELSDASADGRKLVLRHFPVATKGIEGAIYVFATRDRNGAEDWTQRGWYRREYQRGYPHAEYRELPNSIQCLHGISSQQEELHTIREQGIQRIDYRGAEMIPDLSRSVIQTDRFHRAPPELKQRWAEILSRHLQESPLCTGENSWIYRNRLVDCFPVDLEYWSGIPGTIPALERNKRTVIAYEQLCDRDEVVQIFHWREPDSCCFRKRGRGLQFTRVRSKDPLPRAFDDDPIAILSSDVRSWADLFIRDTFVNRFVESCRWLDENYFGIVWKERDYRSFTPFSFQDLTFFCPLRNDSVVAIMLDNSYRLPNVLLVNTENVLGQWYESVLTRLKEQEEYTALLRSLSSLFDSAARYTRFSSDNEYLKAPCRNMLMDGPA